MQKYKINNLSFDEASRTISDNNGEVRKLSQSEVHLLNFLITHKGKVIDKDELMRAGWPNKVVVVNSLTVAVGNLRRAFNDPDIIKSNKGVGYTFSADVNIEDCVLGETKALNNPPQPFILNEESTKLNYAIYVSIIIFLITGAFAINWSMSYVQG